MIPLAERSKHSPRACLCILAFVAKRMQSVVGGHSHSTSVRLCSLFIYDTSPHSKQEEQTET